MSSNRYYKKKKRKNILKDYMPGRLHMSNKRRIKPLYIILAAALVVAAVVLILVFSKNEETIYKAKYLTSSSATVPAYYYNETENRLIKYSKGLPRGVKVYDLDEDYTENAITYAVVEYNGEKYYIMRSSLVDRKDDIVQESNLWVRTSTTVYSDSEGISAVSLAKKGQMLNILEFDKLLDNGHVNRYHVNFTDESGNPVDGWIYGKYLSDSEESALAVNTEIYEIHKDREYPEMELYGGDPENLDWYPVDKPSFESNPLLEDASAMYINIAALENIDRYIELAKESGVNAMVIDIKDESTLAYRADLIKKLSPTSYFKAYYIHGEDYIQAVKKCVDAGFYCIGRIVAFRDPNYFEDHPENCISSSAISQKWASIYDRDSWYYYVSLAKKAVEDCGFNEIQFDCVRFPDEAYYISTAEDTKFRNSFNEEKAQAVQCFCYYACDALHEDEVYVSVALESESANTYVNSQGQYWPAISLVVDAVSGLTYTDSYGSTTDTWTDAYYTVYSWADRASIRQSETPNPAIARTWITAYDVPSWDPTIICDETYAADQIQALADADLFDGFMAWNETSDLSKYQQISGIWGREFIPGKPRT